MNNIHLHSSSNSGILKDDINKERDLEYRKSLPYDAMGDFGGIVGSILPSKIFGDDIEIETKPSWTCTAEKNYYWTFGG